MILFINLVNHDLKNKCKMPVTVVLLSQSTIEIFLKPQTNRRLWTTELKY